MKVLLVSPFSAKKVGGIGTWTKSVLDYSHNDTETSVIFQNTATLKLKRKIKGHFITLKRLFIGGLDSAKILYTLFRNMQKYHPDVVHYTSSAGFALRKDRIAIFIVRKIFKKRFVIHWHFGRIPEMSNNNTREYKMLKKVHRMADASIVLDRFSAQALNNDGLRNIYVVPNALTQEVIEYSSSLDLPSIQNMRKRNTVLFVGHIVNTKGVMELVEVCTQIDGVELIMIGPDLGQLRSTLREIASQRENGDWLTFTGELTRDQVLSYYKSCSLFCLPSYSEGFPYVIMESMACGCPIIATDVGAIPDMLADECGMVVKPKNVEQLKTAINRMLEGYDMAITMGNNAFHKVMMDYSIESVYNSYKSIWNNINGTNR